MTATNSNRILILMAVLLLVAIGAIGYFTYDGSSTNTPVPTPTGVDTSGWQTYQNDNFGFTVKYPQGWQVSESDIHSDTPHVSIGNPLEGKETYVMNIWVVATKKNVSAQTYVQNMLAADRAQDVANSKNGPAPQVTPHFNDQFAVKAGGYDAYELFNVFAFDHNAEQIYVANGAEILVFDFPIASENPNLSSPLENNPVAHEIMNTLGLVSPAGAFCGGIAGFTCPTGFTCKLEGSYPDAGGHCIAQ